MPQNRFQKIDVNLPLRAQSFNGRKLFPKDAENRNRFRSFFSRTIFYSDRFLQSHIPDRYKPSVHYGLGSEDSLAGEGKRLPLPLIKWATRAAIKSAPTPIHPHIPTFWWTTNKLAKVAAPAATNRRRFQTNRVRPEGKCSLINDFWLNNKKKEI